jgi:3-deoxy-D-manno-octulosonate 8-phosphate phosphatase KdsC-like HAD superfamily phosphatase
MGIANLRTAASITMPDGECLKRFYVRDGLGIRVLGKRHSRCEVPGRDSPTLRKRMDDFNVSFTMCRVKKW